MKQYLDLLSKVLTTGHEKTDRTGTGTISSFGHQVVYNLEEGFPLVTTKFVRFESIIHELLWFLDGDTNIKYLTDNNVHIWDEWADKDGNLGPVYGHQWRNGKVDQIANVMDQLINNPDSRRIIVSAWNVAEIDEMALPPCHTLFQFYTRELTTEERIKELNKIINVDEAEDNLVDLLDQYDIPKRAISCQLYQRSADLFLGVPYNIASYSALTMMIAHQLNFKPEQFVHTIGDAHIYNNHIEQVTTQLMRTPHELPLLKFNRKPESIFDYTIEDFNLVNYTHDPFIKAPVAV